MPRAYSKVKFLIEQTVASGLIYLNSHARDLANPEMRPYLDRYLRGSNGYKAEERVKLMKLLLDTIGGAPAIGGAAAAIAAEIEARHNWGDHTISSATS